MRLVLAPAVSPLRLLLVLSCTLFTTSTDAILVAPSSQCAVQCGNVLSSTSIVDLVCGDSSYTGSAVGQTFQNCIACELNSTYVDPTTKQSDLQWLLCAYLFLSYHGGSVIELVLTFKPNKTTFALQLHGASMAIQIILVPRAIHVLLRLRAGPIEITLSMVLCRPPMQPDIATALHGGLTC